MISRKTTAAVAGSLALAAAMASPASADVPTKVTIHFDGFPAHGKVYSPRAVCRQHRKVWLKGVYADGSSSRLEPTFTNRRGKWSISTQLQGAIGLRAKAPRKRVNGVNCAPDRSPTVPTGLPGG
jgi:hypothetical protein